MMRTYSKRGSNLTAARLLALLLAVIISPIPVESRATKSNVLVHIPFALHNATGFPHVQATTFGISTVPQEGRSIAEFVYFLPEGLCLPVSNFTAGHPAHGDKLAPPFILLANAGGACSDVLKARHAQHVGASALVLADPHCRCPDAACVARFPNDTCLGEDPVIVNDGSGGDITIPTFLIFKNLAEDLKQQLRDQNQPCLVELQWGLEDENTMDDADDVPDVRFWTTAYDPLVSLEFYEGVKAVHEALGDAVISFQPRFKIIDGHRFHCEKDQGAACDHLCTNNGRYCSVHAENLSGHAILKETLQRLCIWKHYGENGNAKKYWDYVIYHKQLCSDDPNQFGNEKCIQDGFKAAGIDKSIVDTCIQDSGSLDADNSNAVLDDALKQFQKSGVHALPALTVSEQVLYWTTPESLFESVCGEYWVSGAEKVPEVCTKCSSCPNVIGCLEKGKCVGFDNEQRHPDTGFQRTDDGKKKGGHWKFFWFVALVGTVGGAYYYYDQNRHRFASRGGGGLMNDYMHLSGGQ